MTFDATFLTWLDGVLPATLPSGVRAFSFNLTNVYDNEYAIEVVGASRFDPSDSDWPCDEIWHPDPRQLDIPSGALGANWEDVLEAGSKLVLSYLQDGARRNILKSAEAVGIGFVDGDLHILWQNEPEA